MSSDHFRDRMDAIAFSYQASVESLPDGQIDHLMELAANIFKVSSVILIFPERLYQWTGSSHGYEAEILSQELSAYSKSFDSNSTAFFVIPDLSLDHRSASHFSVTGQAHLRFCAAISLVAASDQFLGTLYLFDNQPRAFSSQEERVLLNLATVVIDMFQGRVDQRQLRNTQQQLEEKQRQLNLTLNKSRMAVWTLEIQSGHLRMEADFATLGFPDELTLTRGADLFDLVHPEDKALTRSRIDEAIYQTGQYELQARLLLPSGRIIWISSRGSVEYDMQNQPVRLLVVTFDITEQRMAETALAKSEALLRQIIETTQDAMYLKDTSGRYLVINNAAARMMKRTVNEVMDGLDTEFIPSERISRIKEVDQQVMLMGQSISYEHPSLFGNSEKTFLTSKFPFIQAGKIEGVLGISRDITPQKRMEQGLQASNKNLELKVQERTHALEHLNRQLQYDAFHDALTGLPNRALFMDRLNQAIQRKQNDECNNFAVLFLDFDRFKLVNDSLGHRAGDELLRGIAERLSNNVPPVNTVARLGGDEFVVLLEDVHSHEEVQQRAEFLQKQLNLPFQVAGQALHITASLGITLCDQRYHQPEEALRDADIAMYRAKTEQKGSIVFFDPSMLERRVALMNLQRDLHSAIVNEELRVHYQPILRLTDRHIVGVEALVRWIHPQHGVVSPAEFIPLAEESGLICEIDLWVLQEASRQLRRWNEGRTEELYLNVNLSARHFEQSGVVQQIWRILLSEGINPQRLRLEITESLLMSKGQDTLQLLRQLRSLGVALVVDDFGTGYSSLGYLQQFPLDGLKIDRSFIANAEQRPEVLQTIIKLGQALNMYLVAEGLETEAQVAQLQTMSCELGQGYFFTRPLPADELEHHLNLNFLNLN